MTPSSENAPDSRFKMRYPLLSRILPLPVSPSFSRSVLACFRVDGLAPSRAQELENATAEMQLHINALTQAKAHAKTVATQTDSYHAAETSSNEWAGRGEEGIEELESCSSITVPPSSPNMVSSPMPRKAKRLPALPVQEEAKVVPEVIRVMQVCISLCANTCRCVCA